MEYSFPVHVRIQREKDLCAAMLGLKVVVEWPAPLLCVTEVSGSILCPHKSRHDVDFCDITQSVVESFGFYFEMGDRFQFTQYLLYHAR